MNGESKGRDSALEFDVRVVPNASKNLIVGAIDGRLKIKISAPPQDGAANKELVRFLAATFGVSRSSVTILLGETSRLKRVRVVGVDPNLLSEINQTVVIGDS